MTGDTRMFNSINTSGNNGFNSITFGENGKDKVKRLGKIAISNDMSISNVLLVESLNFNLCDLGFKCTFGIDDVEIISVDGSDLIFKVFTYDNLYLVDFNASETQLSTCRTTGDAPTLWGLGPNHVGSAGRGPRDLLPRGLAEEMTLGTRCPLVRPP
jgi:hypothetical protein